MAAPAAPALDRAAAEHARVVDHWTPARRVAAIPRDFVLDARGQAYLRKADGTLSPYGRIVAESAAAAAPNAGPPGSGDVAGPSVTNFDPGAGASIGASYAFKATVKDPSGIRSVSFKIQKSGSATQSFNASTSGGDLWSVSLSGFTDGSWQWWVVAKDKAGNTTTTSPVAFAVSLSGGGGGGGSGNVVVNQAWTTPGALQRAAGRIYFEMPANARRTKWNGYVCSGTVVSDGNTANRSIILTAAHCVYDDANKAFARNVLFIPDQDGTTGAGTDRTCSNDPIGCWTTWFGVVDAEYTTRTFPDNSQWDYAHYVVKDTGAHTAGLNSASDTLDLATTPLSISYSAPAVDLAGSAADYTHALGYSYSDDPNFMYCAEDMTTEGAVNWWLPSCGISGGSSGGPWVQNMTNGTGPIVSVNSWGYTSSPGMAGPKLNTSAPSTASCVMAAAKTGSVAANAAAGDAGIKASCP
jgi:hypothetical protein